MKKEYGCRLVRQNVLCVGQPLHQLGRAVHNPSNYPMPSFSRPHVQSRLSAKPFLPIPQWPRARTRQFSARAALSYGQGVRALVTGELAPARSAFLDTAARACVRWMCRYTIGPTPLRVMKRTRRLFASERVRVNGADPGAPLRLIFEILTPCEEEGPAILLLPLRRSWRPWPRPRSFPPAGPARSRSDRTPW